MNRTFTQQDLILFLYDELNTTDRRALVSELESNSHLMSEYEQLNHVVGRLGHERFSPSDTSVNIILEESHSSHPELS